MNLRALIETELDDRRKRNPRYSLRAYARALGTHHATLGQLISGRRRLTPRSVRVLGKKLGLTPQQISFACELEICAAIFNLIADKRFRPNTRWIAIMIGVPIDHVNAGVQRLLAERRLTMVSTTKWIQGAGT